MVDQWKPVVWTDKSCHVVLFDSLGCVAYQVKGAFSSIVWLYGLTSVLWFVLNKLYVNVLVNCAPPLLAVIWRMPCTPVRITSLANKVYLSTCECPNIIKEVG